ncbi:MAG: outer membrane protein assembly factor BamE [Gammaproteobacteria bacterium]|nr:outer membrane protein assembly factor BamE [Gammaproteobacteria bacterium]
MTRPIATLAVALALSTILTSCALPRVYKVTVQQGNVITQQMVDRLKPGMTREQVAYVMGEPVIRNPFDQDRWDYVYTLRVPGVVQDHMKMSLFFTDGLLSHFVGDLAPSDQQAEARDREQASAE